MSDPSTSDPGTGATPPAGRLVPRAGHAHAAPAGRPPAQATLVWLLLKALYRRGRQAALFGLIAAAAAGTAAWFLIPPPLPSATAKLYIPTNPKTTLTQHPDPPMERGTQVALIRSRFVLSAALRPPEIGKLPVLQKEIQKGGEPIDWLAKAITVEFESPEILRLTVTCEDEEQARLLVDAVKDSYLKEIVNKSLFERKERLQRLNDMAVEAKKVLDRQRDTAHKLAQETGPIDAQNFANQQTLIREQVSVARGELVKVQADLRRQRLEEQAFKSKTAGALVLSESVLNGYVADDEAVRDSLQQRAELDQLLQRFRDATVAGAENQKAQKIQADLEANKRAHEELVAKVRTYHLERLRTKSASEVSSHLTDLQDRITIAEKLEKVLQTDVDQLSKLIRDISLKSQDLEPYRLEIKHAESLYTRIKETTTNLSMEQDAPARVVELEKAAVNRVDPEKRKYTLTGIAALAALVGVGGLVGLAEVRMRRVESPESVVHALGMPIVGMIPRPPTRRGKVYGRAAASWQAALTESINCTRTVLLHGEGLSSNRVIQITSPVSGEGKTTLSTHLALSLAMAGRRTLLIDGDLRNPNAHKLFAVPEGPGLCEVLRGEVALADTLQPTAVANLTMLPAGRWTDATPQTLASEGLGGIFAQLREMFDVIIVDSSPVLPVTDPLLLARHVDGVIVALMQGVSRMPLADEAYQRIAVLGVRVLGAVLNGTPQRSYGYGYTYTSPLPA